MARGPPAYKRPEQEAEDDRFLEVTLGPPDETSHLASCPSPVAFAKEVGLPRATARRRSVQMAAGIWAGTRAMIAGLASWTVSQFQVNKLKIVGVFRFVSYDETPLPIRAHDAETSDQQKEKCVKSEKTVSGTTKLFQADLQVAVLTVDNRGEYACSIASLPCPINVIDKGTAKCLKQAVTSASSCPYWPQLCSADPEVFAADIVTADRAKANDLTEDSIYAESGMPRMRLPCFAHIMSTGQGRGFSTISDDISGAIAVGLYMKTCGQVGSFRRCIADSLFHAVSDVLDGPPLPPEHESRVYLDGLLRVCLSNNEAGASRHEQLMAGLSGDVRQDAIVLRVPGSGAPGFDQSAWLRTWASRVSRLLLPSSIPVFPNHRWVNSLATLSELALLGGVHNVLVQAGCKWLSGVKLSDARRPAAQRQRPQWDVLSDTDEDLVAGDAEASAAVRDLVQQKGAAAGRLATALVTADKAVQNPWVAINNKHKKTAWKWFLSNPGSRILAARISMSLSVHMLRVVESIASDRWQTMQFKHMMDTGQFRCRMAAVQDLKSTMEQHVQELLTVPGKWESIAPVKRTLGLASLCFCMFMTTSCALEQMCLSWIAGYPYILWELIENPSWEVAHRIHSSATCLHDEFTRHFLKRFSTVDALRSTRCRACLIVIGLLAHWEIIRIECRHALSRKWALAHYTVGIDAEQLSAKHVLHRHALVERFLRGPAPAASKRRRRGAVPRKRKMRRKGVECDQASGVGGAWRAHQRRFHLGKTFASEDARKEAFAAASVAYARIKSENGPELKRLQALGEAGTASVRSARSQGARVSAFGGRNLKRPCTPAANSVQKRPREDDAACSEPPLSSTDFVVHRSFLEQADTVADCSVQHILKNKTYDTRSIPR